MFQLHSLRILNLDQNCISKIYLLSSNSSECAQALCLEDLSLSSNYIDELPEQLFMTQYFPSLKILSVNNNKLKYLPSTIWLAPRLREFNAMNNEIIELQTRISRKTYNINSKGDYAMQNQRLFYKKQHQSLQNFSIKQQQIKKLENDNLMQSISQEERFIVDLKKDMTDLNIKCFEESTSERGRNYERTRKNLSNKTSKILKNYSDDDFLNFDETNVLNMDIFRYIKKINLINYY